MRFVFYTCWSCWRFQISARLWFEFLVSFLVSRQTKHLNGSISVSYVFHTRCYFLSLLQRRFSPLPFISLFVLLTHHKHCYLDWTEAGLQKTDCSMQGKIFSRQAPAFDSLKRAVTMFCFTLEPLLTGYVFCAAFFLLMLTVELYWFLNKLPEGF